MRILQTSWSKKRKNHLVNFYALEPDQKGKVEIFNPPFSWSSNQDALSQINIGRVKTGLPPYTGQLLHVILDMSSGRLYLPNQEGQTGINSDLMLLTMYDAIRLKIEQLVDFLPMASPINGDPLETLRIRQIKDFSSIVNFIKKQSNDVKKFETDISLPVIEANLDQMPSTKKELFKHPEVHKDKQFLFVNGHQVFNFSAQQKIGSDLKEVFVHQQKAPFIVIDISSGNKISDEDKERLVILGYKEYVASNQKEQRSIFDSPDFQSFKYLMYTGWSFKELSLFVLDENKINSFLGLIKDGSFLFNAAKSLKADGYPDPAFNPYYYTFKIDNDFPINFRPQAGVEVFDYDDQPEMFRIVFFDNKTSLITIKTPLYMNERLVAKVLLSKSPVLISQYDLTEKSLKTDKSIDPVFKSSASFNAVLVDVSNIQGKPVDSIKERFLNASRFERKHISDYPQATEIIKDLCARIAKNPGKEAKVPSTNVQFDDLEVIVGPWLEMAGFLGGYYNVARIKQQTSKDFLEPIPDFKVYPPAILIDNRKNPSVGDRTHIIIHEYRHHINSQLWIESAQYDVIPQEGDTEEQRDKKMVNYLRTTEERLAHKTQFKYMLAIGMSREQIIRKVIQRKPTMSDIPVVKEYLIILNEAAMELDEDQNEDQKLEMIKEYMQEVKNQVTPELDSSAFFDPDAPIEW